jgi:signal peptidase I
MFSHEYYKTGAKRGKDKKGKEYLKIILIAVGIALFLRIFIIEAFRIPSTSMVPTLQTGDHLIVNKFIYGVKLPVLNIKLPGFTSPKHGDIIVFQAPQYRTKNFFVQFIDLITFGIFNLDGSKDNPKNYIKRTIGVPGDFVDISAEQVNIRNTPERDIINQQQIIINGNKIVRKFVSKIDYKSPVGKTKVDLYIESGAKKQYNVQYIDNGVSIQGELYVPKKGDVITVRWIKPERRTETDSSPASQSANVPTIDTIPNNPLAGRNTSDPDRNFITTGHI